MQSLKARYIFPVSSDPIPDGVISLDAGRIVAVGTEPVAGAGLQDLGNVAILPGFVNSHTHLDLTGVGKPLGKPGIAFVDWIRKVIEFRLSEPQGDSVERGLRESLRHGTTTLADIVQVGWSADRIEESGIDVTAFLELRGPTKERIPTAMENARRHLEAAKTSTAWRPGLCPHAPYSVHPRLFAGPIVLSAVEHIPLSFHLAESQEEIELLREGTGPLRELLEELDAWEEGLITANARPLDYLRALPAYRTLIIHGNYLDDEEIEFLGGWADRMSVVYCPRTHAHFAHDPYPLEKMLSVGVNVALGTDSRASSPDLSVLAEMRCVARRFPAIDRDVILRMGTLHGARALGRDQEIGTLEPGKLADLAVAALPNRDAGDPHELLLHSDEPVTSTFLSRRHGDAFDGN